MSKLRNFAVALPVVFSVSAAVMTAAPASAATTSTTCTVVSTGTKNTAGAADSRFVLNKDGTVSASFKVSGNDCKEDVTLATWEAPDGVHGLPYSAQKLFSHVTGTFGTGTHTLTVKMPNCYFQIDLVRGNQATDSNGGPEYGTVSHIPMLGSLHGGTQTCEQPPVTPPVTPPTTPVTPPKTPVTTPAALPNTGTGSNILVAVLGAGVLGTAFQYARQMRAARQS